jgi:hypothetical protein
VVCSHFSETCPLSVATAALVSLFPPFNLLEKEYYAHVLSFARDWRAMTLVKRFRGDLVVRTRYRNGRIEVRLICQRDAHRYWISVTEAEYRDGMTCSFVAGATDAPDDDSHSLR